MRDKFFFVVGGVYFAWSTFRAFRLGRVSDQLDYFVFAKRSNDPVMFWIYIAIGIILSAICVALAAGLIT